MKKDDCIFCKIANGIVPTVSIYEDSDFRVILDVSPAAKGHALLLPKAHFTDLCDLDEQTAKKILPIAGKIGSALKKSLNCDGFNLVQNNGEAAGQTIFHFHMHIIPRYIGTEKIVSWSPGSSTPEELLEIAEKVKGAM